MIDDNTSTTMGTALVSQSQVGLIDPKQTEDWAQVFFKSGLFGGDGNPEVQKAQAQVKILAGLEMGLQPFFSMQNLYVVKQHVFVSAAAFGALVNGNKSTKFITKESSAEKAVIEFSRKDGDKWEVVHTQVYTWAEVPANRKTQSTYQSDRADMLWNRCMTKGARKACPELVGGMKSVEEAHDDIPDGDFTESLIPEELPAAEKVEPVEEKTTPRRRGKGRAKDAEKKVEMEQQADNVETVTPTAEPPQGEESGIVDDIPPEPEITSAEQDALDLPLTSEEAEIVGYWYLTEKFDVSAIIKRLGWKAGKVAELTHGQFLVLQEARRGYIRAASDNFGWGIPDEKLDDFATPDQVKQLQAVHAKAMKNA